MSKNLLLLSDIQDGVLTLTLNRPEVHNAFNDKLIKELISAFSSIDENIRLVVLTGNGRSFCAGADLNWMKSMVSYSKEENYQDSFALASLFESINDCKVPVIGKINGAALGGGSGILACCDYCITHEKAKFGFTEVRLGLIPGVISPFVIQKIGESNARATFLSGEMFNANKANLIGLVHQVTTVENFEDEFKLLVESFKKASPKAAIKAKELLNGVIQRKNKKDELKKFTCEAIAKQRISKEGQEGMMALLEKRSPNWNK